MVATKMWGGWQDRGALFSRTFLPFSALFQAGGAWLLPACWRGWPVFLPGCSVEISGRIGVFTSPLSTLLILPTFQPEKAWSLPGGPLSWFMTGLLSFIYQTQRVEDGCLISFARYQWLWIIFLRSGQPSGGTEVSNHPAVCTVSQTTKCMYNLFNVSRKKPFFHWAVIFWFAPFKINDFVCVQIYNSNGEIAIKCNM